MELTTHRPLALGVLRAVWIRLTLVALTIAVPTFQVLISDIQHGGHSF
jgi:hypothetical protein